VFVTPTGLVMTEEVLRQFVLAQLSSTVDGDHLSHAVDRIMVEMRRSAANILSEDHELMEAISRSLAESEGRQAPPASSQVLEKMLRLRWGPRMQREKGGKQSCSICLADLEMGDEVMQITCGHFFHEDCILPWLKQTNSCPLCRFELPTDDSEYEARKTREPQGQGRFPSTPAMEPQGQGEHQEQQPIFGMRRGFLHRDSTRPVSSNHRRHLPTSTWTQHVLREDAEVETDSLRANVDQDPRLWSVRKLKGVLDVAGVSHNDCLEKRDLINKCLQTSREVIASAAQIYDASMTNSESSPSRPEDRLNRAAAQSDQQTIPPDNSRFPSLVHARSGGPSSEGPWPNQDRSTGVLRYRHRLQGRSPLIERNTASHEYARNPGRSSQDGRQTLRDRYNLPSRPRTGRSAAAEAQSLPSSSRRIRLNPLRDQGEEAQAKTSGSDERRGDPELNQDTNLPAGASAARPTSSSGRQTFRTVLDDRILNDSEDMDDTRAVPAEDPFLRLSREREREWRGTTVRMMTGQNDEDGSFLNRYVRLGR